MRKPGEERHFDRLPLVRRECRQCGAQRLGLLAQLKHVARIGSYLTRWQFIIAGIAFLSAVEA